MPVRPPQDAPDADAPPRVLRHRPRPLRRHRAPAAGRRGQLLLRHPGALRLPRHRPPHLGHRRRDAGNRDRAHHGGAGRRRGRQRVVAAPELLEGRRAAVRDVQGAVGLLRGPPVVAGHGEPRLPRLRAGLLADPVAAPGQLPRPRGREGRHVHGLQHDPALGVDLLPAHAARRRGHTGHRREGHLHAERRVHRQRPLRDDQGNAGLQQHRAHPQPAATGDDPVDHPAAARARAGLRGGGAHLARAEA
mmetsp:Transcript_76523/g.216353  ORF Transcript_76523/g.216353 Transcript_76523/m.216353 type:complete len:248 (+) Transcript_76523:1252-1995(+)